MANVTAKTSSNIFYKARCEAATHNEQLSSREGAADYMSIDRGRLYRIESGIAVPYPEEIRLMADLYNAPELENYFCRTMCPLGCEMPKAELANLDRITVRTLSVFRKIGKTKEMLLDITADGVIDESEKPELDEVSVLQNSKTNAYCKKMYEKMKKNGKGFFPVTVKDLVGNEKFSASTGWITKPASKTYGKAQNNREWEIVVADGAES